MKCGLQLFEGVPGGWNVFFRSGSWKKIYSMEDYSRYRKNINEGSGNNVELLTNDVELYLVIFFSIEIIIVRVC